MGRFKKCYLLLLLMILALGSVGCNKEEPRFPYDNETDVSELPERDSPKHILSLNLPNYVRMTLSVVHDINALKADGSVGIVRYNKNKYYSITPIKSGRYLLILYGENGDTLNHIDGFLVSTLANKDDFKDVSVGMDKEEIIKKDPSACVLDYSSYHRFSDKSILYIKYEKNAENQYVVSDYYYLIDPVSVLDYLLPMDFERIQANGDVE